MPPLIRVLVRGVIAAIMGTLVSRVLATVSGVLVVRYFSDVILFGQFTTITTSLALIASLLGFGLDTWLLREGGRDISTLFHNVQQVLILKLASAVVLLLVLTLAWQQAGFSWLLVVGMLGIVFDSFMQSGYAVLRALQHNRTVAIFQTIASSLTVLLLITLFQFPASVPTLMITQVAASALMGVLLTLSVRRLWQNTPIVFDLWSVVTGASFFFVSDVLANIYSLSSVAILSLYMNAAAVGTFRLALSVISMGFLAPLMLFYVALPLLSKPDLHPRDFRNLIVVMIGGSGVYGLLVMFGIWVAGGPVIHTLYGNKYDSALPFLQQMRWVPLFKAWSFVAVAIMLARSGQRQRVVLQSIVVVLGLVGGFAIIPIYGIIGAAWLYVAIEGFLCLLYSIGAYRSLRHTRS